MKPDWSEAPSWAKFLAMDSNGGWTWYEHIPYRDDVEWLPLKVTHKIKHVESMTNWTKTLEERP